MSMMRSMRSIRSIRSIRSTVCAALALLLAGCPTEPDRADPPDLAAHADGGLDAATDAARDAALDQAGMMILDRAVPDARPDQADPPDGRIADRGLDATTDMQPPPDARPDQPALDQAIAVDAAPDQAIDLDAAPDQAIVDMAPDMAPDQAIDMAPDMAPDPLARPPAGFCAPARPQGWACFDDDRACEADFTCINGRCAPPSAREGPCDGTADCLPGQGLYCARYTDAGDQREQAICLVRTPEGGACHRRNFGCEPGLVCVEDMCRERGGVGSACVTSGDCDLATWCDVDARCALFIQLGDRCNPQAPGCEPGLVCLDERCAERLPPGGGCQNAADCAVGQYCDRFEDSGEAREEAICAPRLAEGMACDGREVAGCSGSVCLEGRCVADQPEEGACRSTFDCEAGFWCPR